MTEEKQEKQEKQENNKPVKKFRSGAIVASVWLNTFKKDDQVFETHTVTVERNYKDKQDEWQSTNSYRQNDIPRVKILLDKCYRYIIKINEE